MRLSYYYFQLITDLLLTAGSAKSKLLLSDSPIDDNMHKHYKQHHSKYPNAFLSYNCRSAELLGTFKRSLKTELFDIAYRKCEDSA